MPSILPTLASSKGHYDGFVKVPVPGEANSVYFGLHLSYRQNEMEDWRDIPLSPSKNTTSFGSLFPQDDMDFALTFDNRGVKDRDAYIDVTFRGKKYCYIQQYETKSTLVALTEAGRKLHFLTQDGPKGKGVLSKLAVKEGISWENAVELTSFLHFKVSFSPRLLPLWVHVLTGKKLMLRRRPYEEYTVNLLKLDLQKRHGAEWAESTSTGIFICAGRYLEESFLLGSLHAEAVIHCVPRLRGGGGGPAPNPPSPRRGQPGLACFGEKSKQEFSSRKIPVCRELNSYPFKIELMKEIAEFD